MIQTELPQLIENWEEEQEAGSPVLYISSSASSENGFSAVISECSSLTEVNAAVEMTLLNPEAVKWV